MKLGKVIRELEVEQDEDPVLAPDKLAPEGEPIGAPTSAPSEPALVPA